MLTMRKGTGNPNAASRATTECGVTQELTPDATGLARAADLLRQGQLVAFPTETVYGLGGDARSDTAVARIFEAKDRPRFNPLIVHVPDTAAARRIALFDDRAERVAAAFWPGPLTLVVPARAETVVAARTLRAQSVLGPDDVAVVDEVVPGTASDPSEVMGLETRVTIYQGRPIRSVDLGAPAIVDRNQAVILMYAAGPLIITAEGRALGRGGAGDRVKVMNVASRAVVLGVVADDGSVRVSANR